MEYLALAGLIFVLILAYTRERYWEKKELFWYQERQDLLNRIQAGTLTDYRESIQEHPPPRGGNMVKAGLRKSMQRDIQALERAGDNK